MSHYREKDGQRPVQAVSNSEEAIRNIKPRKGPRGIYPDALVDPERMPSFMQVVKKITFFDWAKAFGIGTVVGAYFCSEGVLYNQVRRNFFIFGGIGLFGSLTISFMQRLQEVTDPLIKEGLLKQRAAFLSEQQIHQQQQSQQSNTTTAHAAESKH